MPKPTQPPSTPGMRAKHPFLTKEAKESLFPTQWTHLHLAVANRDLRQQGPVPWLSSDEVQISSFCWSTQERAGNVSTGG